MQCTNPLSCRTYHGNYAILGTHLIFGTFTRVIYLPGCHSVYFDNNNSMVAMIFYKKRSVQLKSAKYFKIHKIVCLKKESSVTELRF